MRFLFSRRLPDHSRAVYICQQPATYVNEFPALTNPGLKPEALVGFGGAQSSGSQGSVTCNGGGAAARHQKRGESELPALSLPVGIRLTANELAVKGRTVLWANVADFKGLERSAGLVAELDNCLPSDQTERDAVLYVAFSRPRSLLAVLHTEAARIWIAGRS
jgi:hypothetical protein